MDSHCASESTAKGLSWEIGLDGACARKGEIRRRVHSYSYRSLRRLLGRSQTNQARTDCRWLISVNASGVGRLRFGGQAESLGYRIIKSSIVPTAWSLMSSWSGCGKGDCPHGRRELGKLNEGPEGSGWDFRSSRPSIQERARDSANVIRRELEHDRSFGLLASSGLGASYDSDSLSDCSVSSSRSLCGSVTSIL